MNEATHLERLLRQLRLTHMAGSWQHQEEQALAESWTPSRYLLELDNLILILYCTQLEDLIDRGA